MEFLKKFIEQKEAEVKELRSKGEASQDVNEVRECISKIEKLNNEIAEARAELEKIGSGPVEAKSTIPEGAQLMGSYKQPITERKNESVLDSMEYREAFANYVRTGKWEYRGSTEGMVVTGDIGKVIPNTILQEVIKDLKDYGRLWAKVRKLNIQGGVEVPIEDLVPEVHWITETTVSDNQATPELKRSVMFGYHIAEARIAQSLLSSVVALPMLESEIAKILAEAFVREFDYIILNGTGNGQPLGVLNDNRVLSNHIITMSESEVADWTSWRTKLFAKIGIRYRGNGVLLMTAETWESKILTLKDNNNRPLYTETYNPVNGQAECRFAGREVILVEPDILKNFSEAINDDVFAVYMNCTDYAVNTNLQIGYKRYFDEDTNKWVNKGLTIMDGKLLDVNGCFIIKKSSSTTTYSVTYDGNGNDEGTVPSAQTGSASYTVAAGTGLEKADVPFSGWNDKQDGSGTAYAAGDTITPTKNVTLYAQYVAG